MRKKERMNYHWYFKETYQVGDELKTVDEVLQLTEVRLPHTTELLPLNYFDEKCYQKKSCYYYILTQEIGEATYIRFEGVMGYAKLYLNGQEVCRHKGGYTPFEYRLPENVTETGPVVLAVVVDGSERSDIPPFGGTIDYLTYSGIYREVALEYRSTNFIQHPYLQTTRHSEGVYDVRLVGEWVSLTEDASTTLTVTVAKDNQTLVKKYFQLDKSGEFACELGVLSNVEEWDLTQPSLYDVTVSIGKQDDYVFRHGFREALFTDTGFYLNGELVKIRGLNRHQSFPHTGYAMPDSAQRRDADILKYELGLNLVRTSHYPQAPAFLDRCDEIGLLVFEEIPGWQHIGEGEWQEVLVENVREMILRDRHHASIVLWGVRVNESWDHHELYTRTNEMAKKADPSRQTGGVRYMENSDFLEDVYTMNDFIYDGGDKDKLSRLIHVKTYDETHGNDAITVLRDPKQVTGNAETPYMVTEYAGHMFPTKRFDQEERLTEHALRHAAVLNKMYEQRQNSGAIGWCAFDYNTHADFGSGDRICYHGVMDAYREPKWAASVYASQQSPEERVVMTPLTHWTRGDRNMGMNMPIFVFTNCDEVELHYAGQYIETFTRQEDLYPSLPYPPILIKNMDIMWGHAFSDITFVGKIAGQEVARQSYCHNPIWAGLNVYVDEERALDNRDSWDTVRVGIQAVDQMDNVLPFLMGSVTIQIENGELLTPETVALIGGSASVWVRSLNDCHEDIQLIVQSGTFSQRLTIPVKKN
ncbi:glycoside hydrolase family 2 TIM barrel-domain containing protein [Vagococcus lutrae]|uniref:glycoside hydrolase family 2 protein n=1 Tax=Vagococcus lutrae TaxID=81947 RepID=UPI00288CCA09|nr:glycoside hydrolase family 2 TIM barrel-domain containing protein [Vagococcus lutrae]MDT2801826.1 glycoside hydrolase family 2 TIM barrel-domain containing protein [Vagococcus lutrae]